MKNTEKPAFRVPRNYRIAALLILSLALIVGGINLLVIAPAGSILARAGAGAMVLLGAGGCVAAHLTRRRLWLPMSGGRKMLLGGGAFLIALFAIGMTVLSAGDLKWSGSGFQTACFAAMIIAAVVSLIFILDTQREFTLEGFSFITGEPYLQRWGPAGLRHVYEGDRLGIPLKVSIAVGAPDRHGKPRYVIEALCRIDNPNAISLLAYPDRFHYLPHFPHLPVIPRVPHWEHCIVRGSPSSLVAAIIAPFRKHAHTIFSDDYGFERVRVLGNKVRGRFVIDTGEKHRITDIIEGLVFFSGHFN